MEFRILGPLEVRDGDRALACRGAKQRLLLAVLLLHANEVVSSDRLIEALWGERPPDTSDKALQMHVSQLRKLLEPDRAPGRAGRLLATRPPGYELRMEPAQLDLHRFEHAVAQARKARREGRAAEAADGLRGALALWRGAPLADLRFETFLQPDLARLEELYLASLEDRIDADLSLGRHADVIAELETLAARHPLRERLRAQHMLALYRSGRQAEALEAYRSTRRTLVDELGIEPGRELVELERRILAHDASLEAAAPEPTSRRAAPPPAKGLVGRERELDELLSALEAARSGRGALVLVGGEPGVGKSRLAEAVAGQAHQAGARVLVGRCWEAGGAPAYWPWVQALRSHLRDLEPEKLHTQVGQAGAELATLVPELRERLPDLPAAAPPESEGARFRLFESVTALLRGAAAAQPLAIFLDDLHAADAPSLLLLRFVAGELAGAPILIVGCYRDTEVGPGHPLRDALADLTRETAVVRMELARLGRVDTARLLELVLGRPAPDELASRVHEETAGNALFATEVARLLAAEGNLSDQGGADAGLPIPEGVREAIARRLQRQSDGCRRVLTLASVLGREFDLEALERAAALEQDDLFAALDEAVAARVVGEVPGARGKLRFSHVLVRDTLYDELPPTRRLRLHREIGRALEALYARNLDPHLAELAHHYLEAGASEAEKAIGYAARAGDRAAAQLAYEEAARQYRDALRLLDGTGAGEEPATGDLLLSLGEVLSRAGEASASKQAFRRAAAVAEGSGRHEQLALAALGYGGRFVWTRAGADTEVVPLLERALAAQPAQDSRARVRLLVRLAAASRDEPRRERRVRLAREGVDMARRIGDPATLAYAIEGHYAAVEGPDNVPEGIAAGDELIALGRLIGDKEREFIAHDCRVHAFWRLGDRAGVEVEIDALERVAGELRQPAQRWAVGTARTMLALMEGRFEQAEELISETLELGRGAQTWNAFVSQRIALFVLRRAQGRLAELEEMMTRSVHEYPAQLRFGCALAHLYGELGREEEARAAFADLLPRVLGREHVDAEWLFSMALIPDLCAFLSDEDAAAELLALLLPYERLYTVAPVEATFGSIARGLGVLATTLARFDEAERHFDAALAMERRMRARPWLAHAQHDRAAMLLARDEPGDREEAGVLVADATSAYRDLGMDRWAARAAALAPSAGAGPT